MMLISWPDNASRITTDEDAAALLKAHPGLRVHDLGDEPSWTGKYLATNPEPPTQRLGLRESPRYSKW